MAFGMLAFGTNFTVEPGAHLHDRVGPGQGRLDPGCCTRETTLLSTWQLRCIFCDGFFKHGAFSLFYLSACL
jgi:hypothetical protein